MAANLKNCTSSQMFTHIFRKFLDQHFCKFRKIRDRLDWQEDLNKARMFYLTLPWRSPLSYRNQSLDLQSKSMAGFHMITASVMKELTRSSTRSTFISLYFSNTFFLGYSAKNLIFSGRDNALVKKKMQNCWPYERGKKVMIKIQSIWKDSKLNF